MLPRFHPGVFGTRPVFPKKHGICIETRVAHSAQYCLAIFGRGVLNDLETEGDVKIISQVDEFLVLVSQPTVLNDKDS